MFVAVYLSAHPCWGQCVLVHNHGWAQGSNLWRHCTENTSIEGWLVIHSRYVSLILIQLTAIYLCCVCVGVEVDPPEPRAENGLTWHLPPLTHHVYKGPNPLVSPPPTPPQSSLFAKRERQQVLLTNIDHLRESKECFKMKPFNKTVFSYMLHQFSPFWINMKFYFIWI